MALIVSVRWLDYYLCLCRCYEIVDAVNTATSFVICGMTGVTDAGGSPAVSVRWETYVARTQVRLDFGHTSNSRDGCILAYMYTAIAEQICWLRS